MATYVFGEIPGHPVASTYVDRTDAKDAGVHQVTQQGISGNRTIGANSIVVNGGYEDDLDLGDEIIYTGAGGNDPATKKQIADQTFDQVGNAGLIISEENGLPVRVIRGNRGEPAYSPKSGLRYDGLFRVESHWYANGKSGFRVCRFRLIKLTPSEAAPYLAGTTSTGGAGAAGPGSAATGGASGTPAKATGGGKGPGAPPVGSPNPGRGAGITVRVVRDTAVSNWVKNLYGFACQVCDDVLDLPVGNYAEGAHIRALGKPHNGPDTVDNMLCLCPTHHVLFDKGAIYVTDAFTVHDHQNNNLGPLTREPAHPIDVAHIQYHRLASGH